MSGAARADGSQPVVSLPSGMSDHLQHPPAFPNGSLAPSAIKREELEPPSDPDNVESSKGPASASVAGVSSSSTPNKVLPPASGGKIVHPEDNISLVSLQEGDRFILRPPFFFFICCISEFKLLKINSRSPGVEKPLEKTFTTGVRDTSF